MSIATIRGLAGAARVLSTALGPRTLRATTSAVVRRALTNCSPLVRDRGNGVCRAMVKGCKHRTISSAVAQKTLTSSPPLVRGDDVNGAVVRDHNHTEPKVATMPASFYRTPHLEPADAKRVEYWIEEAHKDSYGEGWLCLSSHPQGDSVTDEDKRAIFEAVRKRKIHTLGLPKKIRTSEVELLLRLTASLNMGVLPGLCYFPINRKSDDSITEAYDLSRQTFSLKALVENLSEPQDLSLVTIYNVPLTPENVSLLARFISHNEQPLHFNINTAPSPLYDLSYQSMSSVLRYV